MKRLGSPTKSLIQTSIVFLALVVAVVSMSVPSWASDVSAGKESYETNCVACHGPNGHVTSAGKSLGAADLRSAKVQGLADEKIREVIKDGKGNMPPFAGLDSDELNSLVQYIRTLKSKPERSK